MFIDGFIYDERDNHTYRLMENRVCGWIFVASPVSQP